MNDPYREWDVAYVLGSLSPSERKDYERHLNVCTACSGEVASLAGLPGILTAVPRGQAAELLEPDAAAPALLIPGLTRAARASRRRARVRFAVALAGAAALGALLTAILGGPPSPPETRPFVLGAPPETQPFTTQFTQTVPSPVTASVRLVSEPWGTRIDVRCEYATPSAGEGRTLVYGLYVVDSAGATKRAGTWSAGPGTLMTPSTTTDTPRTDITRIEIRLLTGDKTLLEARF